MALLAVAPLFLYPFYGTDAIATVLLWLSLITALWVVMSPSCKAGEMPHRARSRLVSEALRDPMAWFSMAVVVYAGVRALNGGIALAYDAEAEAWSMLPPRAAMLPGCVDGCGFFPFAASIALFVLLVGVRHGLGAAASVAFFTSSAALAGIAATVSAIALSYGNVHALDMAACSYEAPSFVGTAYGLYLVCGVAALFGCVEYGWRRAEPFAVLGIVGSAVGLELFSPPATFVVFAVAFAALVVASFALSRGRIAGSASFRCAIVALSVVALVVVVAMFGDGCGELAGKRDAVLQLRLFPEGFASARDAMSSIALKSWRQNPWLGSGVGSFPFDLRFLAVQADWSLISPRQTAVVSAWWHVLVERGIVGAMVLAVGTAFLAWSYFAGLARAIGGGRPSPSCLVGPLVAASLTAISFIDCSLLRPDVILPAAAALSLSAVAFQRGACGQGT